jgi:hypothetical protein
MSFSLNEAAAGEAFDSELSAELKWEPFSL